MIKMCIRDSDDNQGISGDGVVFSVEVKLHSCLLLSGGEPFCSDGDTTQNIADASLDQQVGRDVSRGGRFVD